MCKYPVGEGAKRVTVDIRVPCNKLCDCS